MIWIYLILLIGESILWGVMIWFLIDYYKKNIKRPKDVDEDEK